MEIQNCFKKIPRCVSYIMYIVCYRLIMIETLTNFMETTYFMIVFQPSPGCVAGKIIEMCFDMIICVL